MRLWKNLGFLINEKPILAACECVKTFELRLFAAEN